MNALRWLCLFKHQWDHRVIQRIRDVRHVYRCRRCSEVEVKQDDRLEGFKRWRMKSFLLSR